MSAPTSRLDLAREPDFALGPLHVQPSLGRIGSDGNYLRVEAQTMILLIVLSRAADSTVSRTDLVIAYWQGRIVSDDAIARAIAKVRSLARLSSPPAFNLVSVPKVGYRLIVSGDAETRATTQAGRRRPLSPLTGAFACIALIGILAAGASALAPAPPSRQQLWREAFSPAVRSTDVVDALLNLDASRLSVYLSHGWNPDWSLDSESNTALHTLMLACERNPTHDRLSVVETARMLIDAGADPNAENGWGDTPLQIAASPRYCGPDHPIVAYLRSQTARPPQVQSR